MLGCTKAYYGDRGHIYCAVDKELCGHQKYCDMAMKYKLTTSECTKKEAKHGKKRIKTAKK